MMTASEKDSSEILLTSDEDEEDCDELSCMVALDTILPMDSRFSRLSFQSANSRRLYRRRVSFEHTKSYTLRTTSQGYCHNSQSRLFMIIADDDEVVSHPGDSVGSTGAAPSNHSGCVNNNNTAAAAAACGLIRYTMEELVNDGDEIVVLGFVHEPHRPKDVAAYLLRKVLECQCDEDKVSITIELTSQYQPKPEQALKSMCRFKCMNRPCSSSAVGRRRSRSFLLRRERTRQITSSIIVSNSRPHLSFLSSLLQTTMSIPPGISTVVLALPRASLCQKSGIAGYFCRSISSTLPHLPKIFLLSANSNSKKQVGQNLIRINPITTLSPNRPMDWPSSCAKSLLLSKDIYKQDVHRILAYPTTIIQIHHLTYNPLCTF